MKFIHFLYCPWTGLGLYNGFRGNYWLKNRIQIFKQFVVPSLQNQTCKDFTLWCSWRREERHNPYVKALVIYLKENAGFKAVHTYHGNCFYDDKYPYAEARNRLVSSLHDSIGELLDTIGEVDYVYFTIQPSDDCYCAKAVEGIQKILRETDLQAVGFSRGFVMNYLTGEVAEYNPTTNPPFYTIKFPRDVFCDPLKHVDFTSLKKDVGQYKVGTPCPSHEYVGDCLNYGRINERGFIVGCHGTNISTFFNNPFKGNKVDKEVLKYFGLYDIPVLKIKISIRGKLFQRFPYRIQRKLRYLAGEKKWLLRPIFNSFYNWIRS